MFRHFGAYVRCFGVVPSRLAAGEPAYDVSKADFLRWFGKADVLVDDSVENIAAVRSMGMNAVLYPRPWNGNSVTLTETLRCLSELAEAN